MFDRVILIDKPSGMTSFGVVARVRKSLSVEAGHKVKVGHTGTLDPFATGLMILLSGKECKNAGDYSKLDKVYEATIVLGKNSTTGDPEGTLTNVSNKRPTTDEVSQVLKGLIGHIKQRPPIYSAIKINGERAYKLARQGEVIEMPERLIHIHDLELVEYDYPDIKVRAHVSSGTYIRTLAEDIGKALGTGAYCETLRRTKVGEWHIKDAQTLADYL